MGQRIKSIGPIALNAGQIDFKQVVTTGSGWNRAQLGVPGLSRICERARYCKRSANHNVCGHEDERRRPPLGRTAGTGSVEADRPASLKMRHRAAQTSTLYWSLE